MLNINADTITQAVIARHAGAVDVRLREVMTSLVQHLHAFARDVHLSEDEWRQGLRFLGAAGQRCAGGQEEFVLLSDLLGLSALVAAQSGTGGRTDAPLPVWTGKEALAPPRAAVHAPPDAQPVADTHPGRNHPLDGAPVPCFLHGSVRDLSGAALADAKVCVWRMAPGHAPLRYGQGGEASARSDGDQAAALAASLRTDSQGRYAGRLEGGRLDRAAARLPGDGPAGALMQALGRSLDRPAHLQCAVQAPGCTPLVTQIFPANGEGPALDAIFAARPGLIAHWRRHGPGTAPDGSAQAQGFHTLTFDFALEPRA